MTTGIFAVILATSSLHCGAYRTVSEDGREAVDVAANTTVGETVNLNCPLSGSDMTNWEFNQQDGFSPNTLVDRDVLMTDDPKYTLDRHHRLAISSVTRDDTGIYSCFKGDSSKKYSIYLRVYARTRPLKTTPQNMSVISGGEARFKCSTNYSHGSVWWTTIPNGGEKEPVDVYINGELVNEYANDGRHEVDRSRPGQNDLIIRNVQPDDAGTYKCWDNDGLGTTSFAELTVIDQPVSCGSNVPEGAIVENNLGIKPDNVELSCRVSYHGNIPPKLQWSDNSIDLESKVTSDSDGVIVYTASVGTLSMTSNSTPYFCRINGIPESPFDSTWTCVIESIPPLYIHRPYIHDDGYGECIFNASFPVVRTTWVDSNTDTTVSNNSTFDLLSGPTFVRCIVEANIRNITHQFKSDIRANSPKERPKEHQKEEHSIFTIGIVAAIVVIIAFVVVILAILFCWRSLKKQFQHSQKFNKNYSKREQVELRSKTEDPNNTVAGETQSMV